jgi:hypothetical protein
MAYQISLSSNSIPMAKCLKQAVFLDNPTKDYIEYDSENVQIKPTVKIR